MNAYDIINSGSPIPYVKNFLTQGEADAMFATLQELTPVRDRNKRNKTSFIRMLRYGTYVTDPSTRDKAVYGRRLDIKDAPPVIQALREKLCEHTGKDINYLSVLGYADQYDHINPHQHKEDYEESDASVYVVSLAGCGKIVCSE